MNIFVNIFTPQAQCMLFIHCNILFFSVCLFEGRVLMMKMGQLIPQLSIRQQRIASHQKQVHHATFFFFIFNAILFIDFRYLSPLFLPLAYLAILRLFTIFILL